MHVLVDRGMLEVDPTNQITQLLFCTIKCEFGMTAVPGERAKAFAMESLYQ